MALDLDVELLLQNLRTSRRQAAREPFDMTTKLLKPLLESAVGFFLLEDAATLFARGQIPGNVVTAVRVGRTTALKRADGGARGLVVGDVFGRLSARTIAKQFAVQAGGGGGRRPPTPSNTHSPHGRDQSAWRAMFRGLADMPDGEKVIPFVRRFYDSPSTFLCGDVRAVSQREGEQVVMLLLFCLGQHRALVAVQAQLKRRGALCRIPGRHLCSVLSREDRTDIFGVGEVLEIQDGHQHPPGQDEVVECSRMQAVHGRHVDSGSATEIA